MAQVTVNFDLSLSSVDDPGATYTNLNQAEAGPIDSFVIGFQVTLRSVAGNPVNIGPLAAFCSELAEQIREGNFTFQLAPLSGLAAGTAGQSGTPSSNIPVGGIGSLRAAQVAWLFDNFYISDQLSEWTQSVQEPRLHAFQLALWEVTHDTGLDLSGGSIFFSGQQNDLLRDNAIGLAQEWLDELSLEGIDESYTSQEFEFYALTSVSGNNGAGFQDLVLAARRDSETVLTIEANIPEPRVAALFAGLLALAWVLRSPRKAP
ncbi:MAG: hypothetical protein JJT96_06805 [Opitutales bacterium]|nr:hypothetical protein [Opitutales bacterium]